MDTTWDLSCLYESYDDPRLAEDMEFVRLKALELPQILASDRPASARVREAVELLNALELRLSGVMDYVFLHLSADASDERALALTDPVGKLGLPVRQGHHALVRFVAGCDLDAILEEEPSLREFAFVLSEMKEESLHLLPEAMEGAVMKMQLTGSKAWCRLRDQLEATVSIRMEGHEEPLSLAGVRGMAYSADPAVRKAAYEAELAAYPAVDTGAAACLNGIKGEALSLLEYTGYPSLLDEVLADSRIDREILDAMLDAIRDSLPAFRKYLKAKAALLGHKNGLPFWDLFAPVGSVNRTFTYEEAHDYLVKTMSRFSPKMGEFMDYAFTHRWIDAMPRIGKEGGAFCEGIVSRKVSRILSNFDGSFDSVSTLAHELGHAYHNLNLENEAPLNLGVPMELAETASIFNETFLSRAAIAEADEDEAFALLESTLMNSTQVIVDIYSRYLFESRMVEIRKERTLPASELCELMLQAQRDSYGDGLDPEALHPYMWLCKSHYYGSHFYNFPYAFGLLFGLGVYARYTRMGDAFLPEYDAMLAACGKDTVSNVAATMGIDIRSKEFWASSLREVGKQIDDFCALVEKRV